MSQMNSKRQPCEVYSRVVGWLTPVRNWNKGKRAEYKDRQTFDVGSN
jgi:ribonucleoside-triphosphate reductase